MYMHICVIRTHVYTFVYVYSCISVVFVSANIDIRIDGIYENKYIDTYI